MSNVTRCDVCRSISDAMFPSGWKTVAPIGGAMFSAIHICDECWEFLVDERGEE